VAGSASLDIAPANDVPVTTPVTLTPIAEDSGARLIAQADLLANASDVDGDSLTASGLVISTGSGTLVDNGDGTWTYTPAANVNTAVSFSYTIIDGNGGSVAGSASLDITPANDVPVTTPVTLTPIAEDSGARLITQAELLANASDVDGDSLTAAGLAISVGSGSLVDNGDGTWTYTPAANDDTAVSFSYTVTDGSLAAAGSATVDITPVNDTPTTGTVTLVAVAEDSGPRVITQVELLAGAMDFDGDSLTVSGLTISGGAGSLLDNGNGTWTYTSTANDDTAVRFSYTVTDGSLSAAGSASLDITPVNEAPVTPTLPGPEPIAPAPVTPVDPVSPLAPNPPTTDPTDGRETTSGSASKPVPDGATTADDTNLRVDQPAIDSPSAAGNGLGAGRGSATARAALRDAAAPVFSVSFDFSPAALLDAAGQAANETFAAVSELIARSWSVGGSRGAGVDTADEDGSKPFGPRESTLDGFVGSLMEPANVASVSMTAGFVWWLTRGGGMLATVLMGVPAWRHIDLLPVMARDLDDEDDEDDEDKAEDSDLDGMFDRRADRAPDGGQRK
jgi:Cadherin-like domain